MNIFEREESHEIQVNNSHSSSNIKKSKDFNKVPAKIIHSSNASPRYITENDFSKGSFDHSYYAGGKQINIYFESNIFLIDLVIMVVV